MKALSWVNILLGLWLILSGFVMSGGRGPVMNVEIGIGLVMAACALVAAVWPGTPIDWIVPLTGLATLFAPVVLDYSAAQGSRISDLVIGILAIVYGCVNATFRRRAARAVA